MRVEPQPIELVAEDGYQLSACHWRKSAAESSSQPLVLIAGATGVPQRYYRRFATFLANHGIEVVTVDYRGIGSSKAGSLRGFDASMVHWARYDLAAALDYCLDRGPTAVVAHSFGGHAFGMLPRANETLGLYSFGTGAGWHGHMPQPERLRVAFLWNVVGPVTTNVLGYLPSQKIGLGENLPLGVYRQWKQWCRHPNYFFGDPTFEFAEQYRAVRVPIVAVSVVDDLWATPRSRDAFFAGYKNAPREMKTVGLVENTPLGHFGYFRAGGAHLWPAVVQWLEDQLGNASSQDSVVVGS